MPPFFEPMKDFFKRYKEQARGALFPAHYTCEICRKEVFDGASFCPACERALPRNDGFFCKKCGRRILEDFPVCLECKRELPVYTAARSAFVYGGEIVGLVRRFKTGAKYPHGPRGSGREVGEHRPRGCPEGCRGCPVKSVLP